MPGLLVLFVLLGNGLRSVISSAVFVSEGEFASFLTISIDKTSLVIELLLGAVLISLLVAPSLMRRIPPRRLATLACLVAGLGCLLLGFVFWWRPGIDLREAFVIVLFPLIGFSLATLAPVAQAVVGNAEGRIRPLLTGTWAVAMPAAFLVTPQVVKVVVPAFGLAPFFAGFGLIALALIPMLAAVDFGDAGNEGADDGKDPAWPDYLLAALLALALFEATTLAVTVAGVTSPVTVGLLALCLVALWRLAARLRPARRGAATAPVTAPMSGAATADPGVRYTVLLLAFLFVIEIPTTGFYDTAYLVRHLCSNTLIADRASIGALAQVLAAVAAGLICGQARLAHVVIFAGLALCVLGVFSYTLYPVYPEAEFYIGSKVVNSIGMGLLTTAVTFRINAHVRPGSSLPLLLGFAIILGTEVGIELFEAVMQAFVLAGIDEVGGYLLVFRLQAMVALAAFAPLMLAMSHRPREAAAAATAA